MIADASPLQYVRTFPHRARIFLKREDLIGQGGGNKVRRFQAFFERHGPVDKVVAMSDPGSHTFQILLRFIREGEGAGAKRLHFLERGTAGTSFYAERARKLYMEHPDVTFSRGPAFLQLAKYLAYKWFRRNDSRTIGIGGHVRMEPNPFEEAFCECVRQLQEHHVERPAVHLFPVSSGNMLDGLLRANDRMRTGHSFIGVTTGHRLSIPMLKLKYRSRREVGFMRPDIRTLHHYRERAKSFHRLTGVWLDPIHTIHLYNVLDACPFPERSTVVVWITCPYIDSMDWDHEPEEGSRE